MRIRSGGLGLLSGVRSRLLAAIAVGASVAAAACGGARQENDASEVVQQPVLGDVEIWDGCSASFQRVIRRGLWYGRIAANSIAFQQCMSRAMQAPGFAGVGPYKPCKNKDPFAGDILSTQVTKAVVIGRSSNTWNISCNGPTSGYGRANTGSYNLTGPETIAIGGDLKVAINTSWTTASDGIAPYPLIAQTLWHEAYHQHGYDHGGAGPNDPDGGSGDQWARENAKYCGYGDDPSYHYQVNSLPYIAGACIARLLQEAETKCGLMERCPVSTSLMFPASLDSSMCGCTTDPSPSVPRPLYEDADHDGTKNNKDNCPYTWNPEQENCNADSERVRNEEVMGDACDPVPCASTEAPVQLSAVTCSPNPPPNQDSEACYGTRSQDALNGRALGPHLMGGGWYRRGTKSGAVFSPIPTKFRFCQDNPAIGKSCSRDEVIADGQLDFYATAEAEVFNDLYPWRRVTMQSSTRGAAASWQYGSSAGWMPVTATWEHASDLPFWLGRPQGSPIWIPPGNPTCTSTNGWGNCLNGSFWIHTDTPLGDTSAVVGTTNYGGHGAQLANNYLPIRPSHGDFGWCPMPSPFFVPPSGGGGLKLASVATVLWREKGIKRRIDIRPLADTELIVSTTSRSSNIFAALQDVGSAVALQGSQLSSNCGGDSMTNGLATSLRTAPHWVNAVEPDARIGASNTDVMALALSARYRAIVDAALVSDDTLISTADLPPAPLAAQAGQGSLGSFQNTMTSTGDEIVGGGELPSDRDGWIPIFSRAAEGVFLVNSSPSELWFKRLGASNAWTPLNANVLPPNGTVRAATYSFRQQQIWILHQAPNDAAVCLFRLDPWDDSPVGAARTKVGCWNYSDVDVYLTVDREGDVLVTASGDLGAGPVTATARIGIDAQLEPYVSATAVVPGLLSYPPIVSRRSYAFVVQTSTGVAISRQSDLTSASSPLSWLQTYVGKSCGTLNISGSPASPQSAGSSIGFTASSTCDSGASAEYRFWRKEPGRLYTLVQGWGGSSYTWSTAGFDTGDATIRVDMRRVGSLTEFDAFATATYSIASPTGRCGEITSWLTQGLISPTGQIKVNATATCSQGAVPEYRVEATGPDGTGYVLQNWASTVAASFASPSTNIGVYTVTVLARRQGSTDDYQSRSDLGLTVRRGTCDTVVANGPAVAYGGYATTLNGQATCDLGAQPEYRFLVTRVANGQTTVIRTWSANPDFNWVPSTFPYGSYVQRVEARRYGSTGAFEGVGTRPFKICSAAGGPCP